MDTATLERAARDRSLSPKALGLLTRCLAIGRVLSAEDLAEGRKEGREYVRTGMAELRERGYVISTRMQDPVTGQWVTMQTFASPKCDYPAFGEPDALYSQQAIEHVVSIPTPSGVGIDTRAARGLEETTVMEISYRDLFPKDESRSAPRPKGEEPRHQARMAKPADQWTSGDITEDFAYRVREKNPDKVLGQVGGPALAKIIGSWVRDARITPAELVAALEMFFNDPRLLHDIGQGLPAWRRFISYVPTVRSQARARAGLEQASGEISAEEVDQTAQRALRRLSE